MKRYYRFVILNAASPEGKNYLFFSFLDDDFFFLITWAQCYSMAGAFWGWENPWKACYGLFSTLVLKIRSQITPFLSNKPKAYIVMCVPDIGSFSLQTERNRLSYLVCQSNLCISDVHTCQRSEHCLCCSELHGALADIWAWCSSFSVF